jgi:DNA-3-methyladenine glycosylase II
VEARPAWWEEACAELGARDAVLAEIIKRHPQGFMSSRGAPMESLLRAVVGQQISVKAAQSIWGRFWALAAEGNGDENAVAQRIAGLPEDALRGCGLSGGKVRYVRGIAHGFADGSVHPGLWDGMADDAIIAELVKLPGIGRWTAEMFLMFHLLRPDVLPVDDLGLVKGFKLAYGPRWKTGGDVKLWQARLRRQAEAWRPWRSVAVWYVWRSLDVADVSY